MYFYVDGDNCPGTRTVGISKLKKNDIVKVFYASNNKHFCQENVREDLINSCRGKVEFISVKPGANAVDFAIAVNIAKDCESDKTETAVCMVSGDKHFDIVKCQLNTLYDSIVVNRVETIEEGIMRYYMIDIASLNDLQESLEQLYGTNVGQATYEKLIGIMSDNIEALYLPKNRIPVLKLIKSIAN